jgi:flavin-dependent dehydrogenase
MSVRGAEDYDAVVVGASIAGCTAATLLARAGARVALVERHADPAAYKKTCTHFIQGCSMPTFERLGLTQALQRAGAVHNHANFWTRFGWVIPEPGPGYRHPAHGYNIRREALDPMLRELAAGTPGVDLLLGRVVKELVRDGDRVAGVIAEDRSGDRRRIRARVTVAADGRDSTVASLAGSTAKLGANARFVYWAYYRGLQLTSGHRSQVWFLDPDCAYTFPNEDGVTVVAAFPTKARLPEFKRDIDAAYSRFIAALPDAPPIGDAERVSPFVGKLDMPNHSRRAAQPGLAFVGDAAMTSDPVFGVGVGWALQSAQWLADTVGPALISGDDVDAALTHYSRRHRRRLAAHHWLVCDYSSGRGFNPVEKLIYHAAAHDPKTALTLHSVASRTLPIHRFLSPRVIGRAATVAARVRRAQDPASA